MKKLLCVVLVLCCLLSTVCVSGAAEKETVEPRFTGITQITTGLSISDSGLATCTGGSTAASGYSITVTVELQRDGVTIKTWEKSGTTVIISEGYYVSHNHDYQVITTVYVKTAGGLYLCKYTESSHVESY